MRGGSSLSRGDFTPTPLPLEGVKKLGWRGGTDAKLKKLGLNFRNNLMDQL
jgi:hypothetical protein